MTPSSVVRRPYPVVRRPSKHAGGTRTTVTPKSEVRRASSVETRRRHPDYGNAEVRSPSCVVRRNTPAAPGLLNT